MNEYAPTKQQIKEFEKISKKQLRKKKIKSLNFKLKVYRTANSSWSTFVNFQYLSYIESAGNERENLGIFYENI